jgi:hypothetical protein
MHMNMKPLKVALPPDLRDRLERSAAEHGHSLGLEIRARIEQSFAWGQFDPRTQVLMLRTGLLASLTKPQTGFDWFAHAFAHGVLKEAITPLLARWKPKGDAMLDPSELPANRPVASDDMTGMGIGLEAIVSFDRPLTGDEQRDLSAKYRPASLDDLAPATAALFRSMGFPTKEPEAPSANLPPASAPRSRLRKPKAK